MITLIEELSLNALPAHQTLIYDGWIIRFANGYGKRANSVNPIYESTLNLDEKIRFCEGLYQGKKLPVVFKLTPTVYPNDLDEKLSTRGYQIDSPTSVQILELASANLQTTQTANLQEEFSDEWLHHYCRMNPASEPHRQTLQRILLNIVPRHCFITLKVNGQTIACGLGVLQSEYIGLFDIVTDSAFRNRSYGQQIVNTILMWGKQNKAEKGYLQVMLNNPSALHLYSKIGFKEKYRYWYRIKP